LKFKKNRQRVVLANIIRYLQICEEEWLKPETAVLYNMADEIVRHYM
jgi:hypothetical protein